MQFSNVKFIDDFEIQDFCSLYSDVHCPISLHLQFWYPQLDNQSPQYEYEFVKKFRWDPTQYDEYKRNIDLDNQKEISNGIKKLRECSTTVLQTDCLRLRSNCVTFFSTPQVISVNYLYTKRHWQVQITPKTKINHGSKIPAKLLKTIPYLRNVFTIVTKHQVIYRT